MLIHPHIISSFYGHNRIGKLSSIKLSSNMNSRAQLVVYFVFHLYITLFRSQCTALCLLFLLFSLSFPLQCFTHCTFSLPVPMFLLFSLFLSFLSFPFRFLSFPLLYVSPQLVLTLSPPNLFMPLCVICCTSYISVVFTQSSYNEE